MEDEDEDNVVIAVMLLLVLLALWYECVLLFRHKSDEVDMRLLEFVLLAVARMSKALFADSLRLSERLEAVVVLARFNRNLRIRKMSDILCCADLLVDPLFEAPEFVVLSLVLPTSRVPMKQ